MVLGTGHTVFNKTLQEFLRENDREHIYEIGKKGGGGKRWGTEKPLLSEITDWREDYSSFGQSVTQSLSSKGVKPRWLPAL